MSLGEPHAELNARGQGCTAYDVAVNSNFYWRMQNSDFLRELNAFSLWKITLILQGLSLTKQNELLCYLSFHTSLFFLTPQNSRQSITTVVYSNQHPPLLLKLSMSGL
ncbi:hypothetical protein H8959_006432 [Pygathrix nigripes]